MLNDGYDIKEKRSCALFYHLTNLKFPFKSKRKNYFSTSYYIDKKKDSIYIINKPYYTDKEIDLITKYDKKIIKENNEEPYYINFHYFVQKFEVLNQDQTLFTSTHIFNARGWTESKIFNNETTNKQILKTIGKELKKQFDILIEKKKKENLIMDLENQNDELKKDDMGKLIIEILTKFRKSDNKDEEIIDKKDEKSDNKEEVKDKKDDKNNINETIN
jgi:hypothetical protein